MARSPVCASLVAQTAPTRLGFCDPGAGIGYRIVLSGDGWPEIVDTSFPVMTREEAGALIASANAAVIALGEMLRERAAS